jgi:hypothetical protein
MDIQADANIIEKPVNLHGVTTQKNIIITLSFIPSPSFTHF